MSKENAKKFIQLMMKECGTFSQEDMDTALKEMQGNSELTDDDLKGISGGYYVRATPEGDGYYVRTKQGDGKII